MPGSIVKLGNGRYRLFVSRGYDGRGKAIRLSKVVTATSDRDADRQLAEFYRQATNQPVPNSTRITFKRFAQEWRNRYGVNLSPGTLSSYDSVLETRLLPYFGGMYISKIKPEHVEAYFDELVNCPDRLDGVGKELSKGYIFNLYKSLRAILMKALEWGYIQTNPCQLIPKDNRPKKSYRKREILQQSDLQLFLQALENTKDTPLNVKYRLAVRIMFLCGLRRGELYALKFEDFDVQRLSIAIVKNSYEVKGRRGIKDPKSFKSNRVVYADQVVFELLEMHKQYQKEWLKSHNCTNPEGFVFIQRLQDNGRAKRAVGSGIYHWLQKFLVESDLPRVCVHAIRHMAASYSLANHTPLTTVQAMMGHSSIATTSLYLHSLDEISRTSAAKMGSIFDELASQNKK